MHLIKLLTIWSSLKVQNEWEVEVPLSNNFKDKDVGEYKNRIYK